MTVIMKYILLNFLNSVFIDCRQIFKDLEENKKELMRMSHAYGSLRITSRRKYVTLQNKTSRPTTAKTLSSAITRSSSNELEPLNNETDSPNGTRTRYHTSSFIPSSYSDPISSASKTLASLFTSSGTSTASSYQTELDITKAMNYTPTDRTLLWVILTSVVLVMAAQIVFFFLTCGNYIFRQKED